MRVAKGLGFFVALALVTAAATGCGTEKKADPQQAEQLPEQVVELPEQAGEKEAEQKNQEQSEEDKAKEQEKKNADGSDPNTPVSNQPGGGKQNAPSIGGGSSASGKGGGTAANGGGASPGNVGSAPGNAGAAPSAGSGSAEKPEKQIAGKYQLTVTENFGKHGVFSKSVGYGKDQVVLDVMREHLEIETAHGGGFINSINGTESGYTDKSIFTRKRRDWFYYVNGSISAVGVDTYAAKSGDEVWWDYHDWSGNGSSLFAVIGSYPRPFTVGYNGATPGTVVYFGAGHAEEANRVAGALKAAGAGSVSTAAYGNQDVMSAGTNTVVVGTWAELSGQSNIADLFGSAQRTGLYAAVDGDRVTGLTYQGKGTDLSGTGMILATGTGNGDTTPTWLIIGATEAGLDSAVNALVNNPGALRGKLGAIVDGGTVTGVPAE